MATIFISYSSQDKSIVKSLAHLLEQKGWSVWWDRDIPIGQTYDTVIEEELNKASCVLTIWTARSVASEWVKNEAIEALNQKKLLPILLEDVKIPLAFKRVETAMLLGWDGESEHPELDLLEEAINNMLKQKPHEKLSGPSFDNKVGDETKINTKIFTKKVTLISLGVLLFSSIAYLLFMTFQGNNALIQMAHDETVEVQGVVKTSAEIPIANVEINIEGTSQATRSATDGSYHLMVTELDSTGVVSVTTSHPDYQDKTLNLDLKNKSSEVKDIYLNPIQK